MQQKIMPSTIRKSVKPAEGLVVRDPYDNYSRVPEGGKVVSWSNYWARYALRGEIEVSEPLSDADIDKASAEAAQARDKGQAEAVKQRVADFEAQHKAKEEAIKKNLETERKARSEIGKKPEGHTRDKPNAAEHRQPGAPQPKR